MADITAVWTMEGWLYLAVVLDIFSRMVVGWAMDTHRDEALVDQAACMALVRRHPDRGSQYTAADYRELLAKSGIVVSMSGKGDCYDNTLQKCDAVAFLKRVDIITVKPCRYMPHQV